MALLTLGGVLKRNGVPAQLWDFDLYFKRKGNMTEGEFLRLLSHGMRGLGAQVYAISSICSNFPMAVYLAREIKRLQPDSLILMGGPQPSAVPERFVETFDFIDAVVVGEGEKTLQEMIELGFDAKKLHAVSGVVSRVDGRTVHTPKSSLVEDLDELPIPDYSLIDFSAYARQRPGQFLASLEVGRGCPFSCTFCSTSVMWERKYRVKSPKRIHEEMKMLRDAYGFDFFEFIHDNFTTSRKFIDAFCDYMIENNREGLRWYSSSRTDCISLELMDRMFQAGCRSLFFGIETGSPRMQKIIQKNLNFEKFEPILAHGNGLGIGSVTAFIMGFPEESSEDMDQTVEKAIRYKAAGTANVFIAKLSPLAGTEIFRRHQQELRDVSSSSTLSPQNYGLPYIQGLIRQYPDLFSSYYHVPHGEFSQRYLARFVEFSHLLVNGDPSLSLQALEYFHGSATQAFEKWDPWAEKNGIDYADYKNYPEKRFPYDFSVFLEDCGFLETSLRIGIAGFGNKAFKISSPRLQSSI